ncbi:hypothetical protein PRIPAC_89066, partial [Pristionchus pacificus]|uniref:Uncharacterized protein n=1 Tax=Pristionchus pacificus TaxID=54126 RepID=A0A2A6B5I6_PRIPA
ESTITSSGCPLRLPDARGCPMTRTDGCAIIHCALPKRTREPPPRSKSSTSHRLRASDAIRDAQ